MNFNINPMGWYESANDRDIQKEYVNRNFDLIVPAGHILAFQISQTVSGPTDFGGPYALIIRRAKDDSIIHQDSDFNVTSSLDPSDSNFAIVKRIGGLIFSPAPNAVYYATLSDAHGRMWFTEYFSYYNDVSKFLKITYSSKEVIRTSDQTIVFEGGFQFTMYLDSVIARPSYEYTEEAEEKGGYKFVSVQVAKKVFRFSLPVPEFLVDAMSILRLCDFVRITDEFRTYNCTDFLMTPEWSPEGDLAFNDCEFSTSAIIKKIDGLKNIDNLGEYSDTQYNEDYKNNNG